MTKARKFKKKLTPKLIRKKAEPVLSVELVRKETLQKVRGWVNRLIAFTKNHEPRTNNQ